MGFGNGSLNQEEYRMEIKQVLENKKVDMHVERNLMERLRSQKDDLK